MEAAALPVVKDVLDIDNKHRHRHHHHHRSHDERLRRLSGRRESSSVLFGGHAAPQLDVPYQVTVKDNRDSCHAVSMMKVYKFIISVCCPGVMLSL